MSLHVLDMFSERMHTLKARGVIFALTLLTSLFVPFIVNAAKPSPIILVVHSYHQGFRWTDNVMAGMLDVFKREVPDADVHVEYLDVKRFPIEKVEPFFGETLSNKHVKHRPDIILVSDDAAFDLMLNLRDKRFPGTPLVFCGVNDFKDERVAGRSAVTGVVEDFDLSKTIDVALSLHPNTKHIAVISDVSETGRINLERLRRVKAEFAKRVEFIELAEMTEAELCQALSTLPRDALILNLSFYIDRDGKTFNVPDMMALVTKPGLPVYVAWDFVMGHGPIGGFVVSGHQQGEAAASMATRVLKGIRADNIPIMRTSPNVYMFDFGVMERFGIKESALPKGSIVINKPFSVFDQYRAWIIAAALVGAALLLLIVALLYHIKRAAHAQSYFYALFSAVGDPVLVTDKSTGVVVECNEPAERYFGKTREQLIGAPRHKLCWPVGAQQYDCFAHAFEYGAEASGVSEEVHLLAADEKERLAFVSASPFTISDKTLVVGVFHDITERKRTEAELLKRLGVMEQTPATIVITDMGGRIEYVNPFFSRLTGYSAEEALGQNPRILKSGLHDTAFYRGMWETLSSGNIWSGEICNRKKDATLYWEHAVIAPVASASGRITNYIAIKEDITEAKRSSDELLAAKVAAEEANRVKSEFLANMSHEVRTPLNGVLGMLQLLQQDLVPEERAQYTELAYEAGSRLLTLLNDVLDFSKLDAVPIHLASNAFCVDELVDGVAGMFLRTANQRGLKIEVTIDPSVPKFLVGDDARLRQILCNLVGNAIKFTPSGSVHVEVWSFPSKRFHGKTRLYIKVGDTGIGIPDDKQACIFEPFTQADASYSKQYQGAGLGLAIVKRVVDLMGGQITLDSEVGVGTTLYLNLLLDTAERTDTNDVCEVNEHSLFGSSPLRILLVEDEPINQLALQALLRRLGHEIITASDGKEALSALQQRDFDCILMDIQMPVMNGIEATRAIRNGEAGQGKANIHIVAATAYDLPEDREKCLEAGMDDHVSKPLRMEELLKAIAKVMHRRLSP